MNGQKITPHFSYELSTPYKKNFGCIVADDVVFHRVSNFNEFYSSLGYTNDISGTGALPDEFIWDRYTRDNAAKSVQCLQTQITVYLYNHSEMFREKYGGEYANLLGKCISNKIDDSLHCLKCIKHPSFLSH